MYCSQCRSENDNSAKFCFHCGKPLTKTEQGSSAERPVVSASNDTEEFYKAIIGPKNQSYYLRQFSRFDARGKAGVTWHWPAFFVTFYWLLYRKLWLYAAIYFVLPYAVTIALGIVAGMAGKGGEAIAGFGYVAYFVSVFALPPFYANAIYYSHCKKKIAESKASTSELQRALGELSGRGGTSNAALLFVFVFGFIAVIGILAAIAIPAYQDYTVRARVAEAVEFGDRATSAVATYYEQNQRVPDNLEAAGFVAAPPSSVRGIQVDSRGVVAVTMATPPVTGQTVLLVPSVGENSQIVWTCRSDNLKVRYLPARCRDQR